MKLENWLKALKKIDYAFQPIINSHSGNLIGVEALIRNYQEAGFESIPEFFKAAKKDAVSANIETELRNIALKKFTKIPFYKGLYLFFNTNLDIFDMDNYIPTDVDNLLRKYDVQDDTLCLEFSGRNYKSFFPCYKKLYKRIKNTNVRLAIDDFGLGSSDLMLMYNTKPDFIKFDRFFIENLHNDIKKRTFAEYLLKIATLSGFTVIAMGVETEQEFLFCNQLGYSMVQRSFVQKPTTDINKIMLQYPHIHEISKHEKRNISSDETLIRKTMHKLEPIAILSEIEKVFQQFKDNPNETIFPAIDNHGHPLGIINEKEFKSYMYSPFGKDLLLNKSLTTSIKKFISNVPAVDIDSNIEAIIEMFSHQDEAEGIIITENYKYAGFLFPKDIINIINYKEVEGARSSNALTRLPGNTPINNFISKTLSLTDNYAYFIYFDFDFFKPFNDHFGLRLGDRAILLFRDILQKDLSSHGYFIGHVGGDDFFAGKITEKQEFDAIFKRTTHIIKKFSDDVLVFYDFKDQQSGFYLSTNRLGKQEKYPLLTVSAAIVELSSGRTNINEDVISKILAKIKKAAKRSPVNCCSAGIYTANATSIKNSSKK